MTAVAPDTWRVRYPDGRVTTCTDRDHAEQVWQGWGGDILKPGEHDDRARAWLAMTDAYRATTVDQHPAGRPMDEALAAYVRHDLPLALAVQDRARAALAVVLDELDDLEAPAGTAYDQAAAARAAKTRQAIGRRIRARIVTALEADQ